MLYIGISVDESRTLPARVGICLVSRSDIQYAVY